MLNCQFIVIGSPSDVRTVSLLEAIRKSFIPNRVLIHLNTENPPNELAKTNSTVRSLINEKDILADIEPNVRICENFTCGLPIKDVEELLEHIGRVP